MDGLLSDLHRERFKRWIDERTTLIGKCPVCGNRHWTLLNHFVEVPIYRGGNMLVGGESYPNVGLLCSNCGNTQLINAVVSGILKEEDGHHSEPGQVND